MRNCFLVHNNWFLDQLETSQLLEYVWHALFGGDHGTTVRSADAICSLWGGQTQLFEEFFKLREGKKSRTCISTQFVTINPIINKPLKTQWPWEKSEPSLEECAGDLWAHPTGVISRWGACGVSTGDCEELRLNHNTPSYAIRWSLIQTHKVLQLEASSWSHRCMLHLKKWFLLFLGTGELHSVESPGVCSKHGRNVNATVW